MNTVSVNAKDDIATIIEALRAELRDPAKPLALLVRFSVTAGNSAKVEAAFGRARPQTLNEPGCRAFELNRDARDPGRFVVYEQWRTLADLEAHFRTDYFSRLRAEFNALIADGPEFRVLLPAA